MTSFFCFLKKKSLLAIFFKMNEVRVLFLLYYLLLYSFWTSEFDTFSAYACKCFVLIILTINIEFPFCSNNPNQFPPKENKSWPLTPTRTQSWSECVMLSTSALLERSEIIPPVCFWTRVWLFFIDYFFSCKNSHVGKFPFFSDTYSLYMKNLEVLKSGRS